MINCKNCSYSITEKFCGNCGQPAQLKRVDFHYIQHEIEHVLHLDKGILYTTKELLLSPGQGIRSFISDNRSRLVKPIIFVIITSLIYTIIANLFPTELKPVDAALKSMNVGPTATQILHWVESHYGYANIISSVIIALMLKLCYRRHNYNFFEILIVLCFVMGMGMLILAVFKLIEGIAKVDLTTISTIVSFAYSAWAIGQFYNEKKLSTYVKSFIAFAIGGIIFNFLIVLAGGLIDHFIKH